MKSDKRQTKIMIGISLLVIAGVFIYISLSQPKIYIDDSSNSQTTVYHTEFKSSSSQEAYVYSSVSSVYTSSQVSYPINLNTATVEELMSIDGLGEKRAAAIIAYRQEIGSYSSVSQIKDIYGIGESVFEKVSPYLTV